MAERLRKIRKDAGLTQKEFAKKVGVSRLYVSVWETNQSEPGKTRLYMIADLFHVNIHWLQTGEGDAYITDDDARERIEREYIAKLFSALPSAMQEQILSVLREAEAKPSGAFNILLNNGAINGNINQDCKDK
jgi:transcriptional regulator with XRE-family HTH domain